MSAPSCDGFAENGQPPPRFCRGRPLTTPGRATPRLTKSELPWIIRAFSQALLNQDIAQISQTLGILSAEN
jgi:hypothetical protein